MNSTAPDRILLESVLRSAGPARWDAREIRDCTDELLTVVTDWDDEELAEVVAHVLWVMGAGGDHLGCRYHDGDFDADYSNECKRCRKRLGKMATHLVRALHERSA